MKFKKKISLIMWFVEVIRTRYTPFIKYLMRQTIELKWENYVRAKAGFPNGLPVVDLLELAPDFHEQIHSFTFLDGTSRVIDIALLKALSKQFKSCAYLEIGSWRGESLINMADTSIDSVSMSLSEKEMRQMNFPEEMIKLDGFFLSVNAKITRIGHNSLTYDFSKLGKKFDLIFVDGDHSYEALVSDSRNVFSLLKDEHSIIVWHDCGFSYEDMRYEVIAGILDGLPKTAHPNLYRVSNTLCGIYTNKKLQTSIRKGITTPNKKFRVTLKAEKI